MNFEYTKYLTVGNLYFFTIDNVTGSILASTDPMKRVWFTDDKAIQFKKKLEDYGVTDVEVHDGREFLEKISNKYRLGKITEKVMMQNQYLFRDEEAWYHAG